MKPCILLVIYLLASHVGAANIVTPFRLAEHPSDYNDKYIKISEMRCADVYDGFTCKVNAPPFLLKIDALALGKNTTDQAAERMLKCRGEDALRRRACQFGVKVTPKSNDYTVLPEGNVVRIIADEIDVF